MKNEKPSWPKKELQLDLRNFLKVNFSCLQFIKLSTCHKKCKSKFSFLPAILIYVWLSISISMTFWDKIKKSMSEEDQKKLLGAGKLYKQWKIIWLKANWQEWQNKRQWKQKSALKHFWLTRQKLIIQKYN